MEKFSNDWSSFGGDTSGIDIIDLLKERPANMARNFHSSGSDLPILPEGRENFMKRQNMMYPWDNSGKYMVKGPHSDIEDDTDSTSFKRVSTSDIEGMDRRTVTKIFK